MATLATVPPTSRDGARSDGPHPAPEGARVALAALWFGVFGAPVAWSVQTLVDFAVAAHGCFPRAVPLAGPVTGGLRGLVFGVSLAALAVGVAALAVAWRSWGRTRREHQAGSGRGGEHPPVTAALETGEGRTRFMALAGVLVSATFVVVSAAHTAALFLVPPCSG